MPSCGRDCGPASLPLSALRSGDGIDERSQALDGDTDGVVGLQEDLGVAIDADALGVCRSR